MKKIFILLLFCNIAHSMDTYDLQCRFAYAIIHQMYPRIIEMLNNGININHPINPLRQAVKTNNMKLCKLFLTQGARPDGPNQRGYPLIEATRQANIRMCRLLLEHGANPNTYPDSPESSAIDIAINEKFHDIYRLLSDAGASCDLKNGATQYSYAILPTSEMMICNGNINPYISLQEFQDFLTARSRIATALKAFKNMDFMPKEVKKIIFTISPELHKDLTTSCKFGVLKNIKLENASKYPIPLLKYLIRTKYFMRGDVVHQLKEDTLCLFEKRTQKIVFEYGGYNRMKLFLPQHLEKNYGIQIETTIRQRLSSN